MNIPDKAIEAAVRALGCDPLDESFSAGDRAYWQEAAKAAVGASSPFIAAQALRDAATDLGNEGVAGVARAYLLTRADQAEQ